MRDDQNIALARRLRRRQNAPEAVAWSALRTMRAAGVIVRRQHPVGPFVVDFAIALRKIAFEIDGGIHRLPEVALRDAARQRALEALGWRVIRLTPEIALSREHLLALVERELGVGER